MTEQTELEKLAEDFAQSKQRMSCGMNFGMLFTHKEELKMQ